VQDYSLYAGCWVALDEDGSVAGVGATPEEAGRAGRLARPKARLQLARITPQAPYLALPQWPLALLRPFSADRRVWLVGGAVRDLLLGRPPHDWDFAVERDAVGLARRVANALGGAYVLLDAERDTARAILEDPLSRTPVTLDFASLREETLERDLFARDFTLNAMALTPEGELLDPTGGQRDLAARCVRVTTPASFTQDPARLLRAVRTAAELGFHIEPQTLVLLRRHVPAIETVAAERIRPELLRILQAEPATTTLRQIEHLGLLARVLPEIAALRQVSQSAPHHYANVLDHSYAVISATEALQAHLRGREPLPTQTREVAAPSWAWTSLQAALLPHQTALLAYLVEPVTHEATRADLLRWGALFHDAGKASARTVDAQGVTHFYGHNAQSETLVQERFTALRFAARAQHFVGTLVNAHMRLTTLSDAPEVTRRAVYRFFRDTGDVGVAVVLLSLADILAVFGPRLEREYWQRVLRSAGALLAGAFTRSETVIAPPRLLNGHDLQALGIPPGPALGALLEQLREAQAAGEIQTREEAEAFVRAAREATATTGA